MLEPQEQFVEPDGDRGGERKADAGHGEDAAEPDPQRTSGPLERPRDRAVRAAGKEQRRRRREGGDRNRPDGVEEGRTRDLPRQLDRGRDDARCHEAEEESQPGSMVRAARLEQGLGADGQTRGSL